MIPAKTGSSAGNAIVAQMKALHSRADFDGKQPARQKGGDPGRRRQRAPQVVQHFPKADEWQRPAAAIVARRIAPAQYPGQQLPISAGPAVLTRGGHVVARWEFLDYFDVGNQSSPGKRALEEVVTEQCSLGHAIGERRLEGVDVINALAGIGTQTEEILVHVRGRGCVGVDSARAGEHALKERAFAPIGRDGATRG
jgi:hypothetical protein